MLPFDFDKKETSKALRRIEAIFKSFIQAKGKMTLVIAGTVTEASSSNRQINWGELIINYR